MKNNTPLAFFYLLFAIARFFVPWYFNAQQLMHGAEPFTVANYLGAGMANYFTSSITTDFFIGTIPVLVWMMVEGRRQKMKNLWFYFLFTFLIAFAFTCPLFLFMREMKLSKAQ
jgi:hypothetical protein